MPFSQSQDGISLSCAQSKGPQAVPGVLVSAGNAPLIPAYLLSHFMQVQTAVNSYRYLLDNATPLPNLLTLTRHKGPQAASVSVRTPQARKPRYAAGRRDVRLCKSVPRTLPDR